MKLPRLLLIPLALLLALFLTGAPPATKKAAPKPQAKGKTTAATKSKTKKKQAGRVTARQSTQQQPDEQRTREIQEALAAKGYDVEATGVWGPKSVEALKKFQEDQNITNISGRGKLDPLTLIALGLGPSQSSAQSSGDKAPTEGKQQ